MISHLPETISWYLLDSMLKRSSLSKLCCRLIAVFARVQEQHPELLQSDLEAFYFPKTIGEHLIGCFLDQTMADWAKRRCFVGGRSKPHPAP